MPTTDVRREGFRGLRDRYPRLMLLPASIAMGVVAAMGYARKEEVGMAVFAVVLMTVFGVMAAFSKDESFVAASSEADERQRSIDLEATRIAYLCVTFVAVTGFMWEIYTRDPGQPPGAFMLICSVGGLSHGLAFRYLQKRR